MKLQRSDKMAFLGPGLGLECLVLGGVLVHDVGSLERSRLLPEEFL